MVSHAIIDREQESDCVERYLRTQNNPHVILISAKTGVGKTAFAQKVMKAYEKEFHVVKAQTNQTNDAKLNDEGLFLSRIFYACCEAFKDSKRYKYKSFVMKLSDKGNILRNISMALDATEKDGVKKSLFRFVLLPLRKLTKSGDFDYSKKAQQRDLESKKIMYDYISYVLDHNKILLYVDGLHNIDQYSLSCMTQWIGSDRNSDCMFLLEHTLSANDDDGFERMKSLFDEYCSGVCPVLLAAMDYEHALCVAGLDSSLSPKHSNDSAEFYLQHAGGNLWKLKDYFRKESNASYSRNTKRISEDPSCDLICALTADERLILAIVFLHDGAISERRLGDIIKTEVDSPRVAKCLANMSGANNQMIERHDGVITISHASILDSLKSVFGSSKATILSGFQMTETYYKSLLACSSNSVHDREAAALMLISLYDQFDKSKLLSMLPYLEDLVICGIDTTKLLGYLESIVDSVRSSKSHFTDTYYSVIELCYRTESYEDALNYLDEIEESCSTNPKCSFLRCQLLIANENYEEALAYIGEALKLYGGMAIGVYLELFQIIAMHMIARSADTSKLYAAINNKVSQMAHPTTVKAFLLRLSEVSRSRLIALDDVKRSVNLFLEEGLDEQAGKSELSLGFLYAIQGRFDEAQDCYDRAELRLGRHPELVHMFRVNSAAISLLKGIHSNDVWRQLEEAERAALTQTSKIAIQTNKLAFCLEKHDIERGQRVARSLGGLVGSSVDAQFLAIAHYNLYLYFTEAGQRDIAELHLERASRLRHECNTVDCRLSGTMPTDGTKCLLEHPWHVCFLSCINIDLIEDEASLYKPIDASASTISS